MNRPILATVLTVVALRAQPAQAQQSADTLSLTLATAIQQALEQGEEMRLARAQVTQTRGQVRQAFASALPQINGTLTYTRQFASVFQNLGGQGTDTTFTNAFKNSPFGAANTWNAEITASQLLFTAGKVPGAMAAARSAWQAANSQQAETAGDLTYRVKRAYLEAQYARRLYEVAVSGLDQARQQLRQVTLFQQAGTRAEYDLLRAQVDAANQDPVVVATRNSYDIALLELKRLVNLPADRAVALVTPMVDQDGTIPVLAENEVDVVDRPALAAAEATVRVRQQLLRVAKADRWPSLSVQSTFSEQAFPSQVLPFDTKFRRSWNAALKVSVPIFNGFRTEGAVEQARADLDRAMAERDQVAENVRLDLAQARAELDRTRALAAARQETVRQAKRAQYLASVRYTNGLSTQLEVSDARLLAQQAEVNEVQATRDYLVALAQLERALGRPVSVVRRPLQQAAAGTMTGEGSSSEQ